MIVTLYTFSKRHNSTARPTGGADFSVQLKDKSSVINPVLEFRDAPYDYNYAYIAAFSRWYFMKDPIWNNGTWIVELSVDVLATWSAYIKQTTAQVLFSSSDYSLDLIDNRIPATGRIIRNTTDVAFQGCLANQYTTIDGYFALTVLDDVGLWATGVTTTYFLNYTQMQAFAQELINQDVWQSIKQFFDNPMDAIIDCYYLPIDVTKYGDLTVDRQITIGNYTFTATGKSSLATNFKNKYYRTTIDIDWPYNDFRRLSPYTTLELFVPFCGSNPISPESCYQMDSLFIDYSIDITTGAVEAICYIKETVLAEFSGNCRIQLPVGQTQSRVDSIIGATGGLVMAGAGVLTGNVALGASGVLSAVSSAVSPTMQKSMGGFNGTILGAILGNDIMRWQQFRLSVTSHETNASPASIRSTIGNVNGNVLSLAELTGYVQTSGFSVSAPCTESETNMINQMMDGGVYL